ncbi:DUF1338 domain-containing protein [Paraglaciecola chathamensis]|uniref:2-oxoadipate dioxygenase/decarboxylase n=2 Tax=Paraglaciecola chathamensis TaxID=368405 RepID=A0ABQ0I792_9ALTE|nr:MULTISPECIES: DUF1338 domain-containing protein [Paraglaciecola]GAC05113.1 hypothetical protein GAGA_2261 [Paraglaciecola agarilytica NO2]GAC11847.1 hypothetical protein GCHA_3917 [Paraglaciecola chathamensis S18K6]
MHTNVNTLFEKLWESYLAVTPSAVTVHDLFDKTQGQEVVNDHIALRTFNLPGIGLSALAAHFEAVGYKACGEYHFVSKKLYAKHFEHTENPDLPKVFISELLLEQCSESLQETVRSLVANMDKDAVTQDSFLYSGRHWDIDYPTYQRLLQESEFAAWVAAWGYRANHFTVSNNHLSQFDSIEQINQAVKAAGLSLNTAGGEIKGSVEVMLEQSSTLADKHPVAFTDGERAIPSCFYEFAKRYPKSDGSIFTGFVAESADKIFESTNAR